MKICKRCNQEKSSAEFHTKSSSADGLFPYCKECRREIGGYTEREPPKLVEATPEKIEAVAKKLDSETQDCIWKRKLREKRGSVPTPELPYEQLVAESLTNAEHPALQKSRNVRSNVKKLEQNPRLTSDPFHSWDEQQESIADMLFDAWDKHQKQDTEKYRELNERLPVVTPKKAKRYEMAERYSFEWLMGDDYREGSDD